ncbi:MAG: agmatine deiminase family protein [Calothrix sp. MO_167.B12]|nr:agmatine deiminase family protein [Calothrix sp. MO_167.B12]
MQRLNYNPKKKGFYMPAQWAAHELTILAWPFGESEWQGALAEVRREFMAFLRRIMEDELVLLLLAPGEEESFAQAQRDEFLSPSGWANLRLATVALDDIWMRDIAPIQLIQKGSEHLIPVKWQFNGWGGKFSHSQDCTAGYKLLELMGVDNFFDVPVILEGGAVEVDGKGTGLTTRCCLLNPNRSRLDEEQLSQIIKDYFGLERLVWLDNGLVGDHTDGHIDMVARFTPSGNILINHTEDRCNPHFHALQDNYEQLSKYFGANRLVFLPLPQQTIKNAVTEDFADFSRIEGLVCANYANFYVTTHSVIVPAFEDPTDEVARSIVASCFPQHKVVSLTAKAILQHGGGIFNCLAQQVPKRTLVK